jgi:hypothetical protein
MKAMHSSIAILNRRKLLQAAGLGLVTTAIAKPAIAQAQGPIKIALSSP